MDLVTGFLGDGFLWRYCNHPLFIHDVQVPKDRQNTKGYLRSPLFWVALAFGLLAFFSAISML